MDKFYFDMGSSTIKLYRYDGELSQVCEKSIMFKKDYTNDGVSDENLNSLFSFINLVKNEYGLNKENTRIFATGIWRKIPENQIDYLKKIFLEYDLVFNVISHEQENDYFEKAMYGDYNNRRIMMVNMGGKTTELVIFADNKLEKKINLDIGVRRYSCGFSKYK